MKHGPLKHTIIIQRPDTTGQDSAGQPIIDWVDVVTVKASIEQLTARERSVERFVSAQVQATSSHRIRMLYTTLLNSMDETWRIVFGIRIFQLAGMPNNVRERNREFEFLCIEYPAVP
jgi:SPP1 family predicted phage head-tail adaptor